MGAVDGNPGFAEVDEAFGLSERLFSFYFYIFFGF